jgi:hypothetical protein
VLQRGALGAQAAKIGRVFGITAYADNFIVVGFDQQTATDSAVTTRGFD